MSQVAEVLTDEPAQQEAATPVEDSDAPAETNAAEQQDGPTEPGEPPQDPEASATAGEEGEPVSAEAGEAGAVPEGDMAPDGGAATASPEEGSGEAGAEEPHAAAEPGQAEEVAEEGQAPGAEAEGDAAEGGAAEAPTDVWDLALDPKLRDKLAVAAPPPYVPPEVGEDYVPVAELPPLPLPYSVDEATGKKAPLAGIESIFLTGEGSHVHGGRG